MKITGFGIREALRRWELKRDSAQNTFNDSLKRFPGEEKILPKMAMDQFSLADAIIAKLQVAQDIYNLAVSVKVQESSMLLAEAIKLVGGAGRREKMWRTVFSPKRDRYALREDEVRKTDEIRAELQISITDAQSYADAAARFASSLRFAIAQGNIQEVDINVQGLEPFMLA